MQEVIRSIIEKLEEKENTEGFDCEEYEDEIKMQCYKDAINIVKQEAEQYNNGWIPCEKELPYRTEEFCVTKMCKDDNTVYEVCNEIFWTRDNKWDCERDEYCEWKVIAWKEKDKPYQPKGECE